MQAYLKQREAADEKNTGYGTVYNEFFGGVR